MIRSRRSYDAQLIAEPLHFQRVAQGAWRQIQMRVAVANECNDPHESDEYFVTIHPRDGSIQARYFAAKAFAVNRVERIDVPAWEFAREIAKIVTPCTGSYLGGGVL